ncbi:MAG: Slp family lipoprotein [Thermodesulfobacteriota bacterium]
MTLLRNMPGLMALGLLLLFTGCAAQVPREVTRNVTFHEDFTTLQDAPDSYVGEFGIFGGKILKTKNREQKSEIIVLQFPLDDNHRPRLDKASGGRFLIFSDEFLDPEVYSPGTRITVAGKITGSDVRPIGSYAYEHPVIKGRIWTWEPRKKGFFQRIRFGIGVGTSF